MIKIRRFLTVDNESMIVFLALTSECLLSRFNVLLLTILLKWCDFSVFLFQDDQVADRVAFLAEKMFLLERRANSSLFPAKTCRDLKRCHPGYPLRDGKFSSLNVFLSSGQRCLHLNLFFLLPHCLTTVVTLEEIILSKICWKPLSFDANYLVSVLGLHLKTSCLSFGHRLEIDFLQYYLLSELYSQLHQFVRLSVHGSTIGTECNACMHFLGAT